MNPSPRVDSIDKTLNTPQIVPNALKRIIDLRPVLMEHNNKCRIGSTNILKKRRDYWFNSLL
jgi:hypothetical protein